MTSPMTPQNSVPAPPPTRLVRLKPYDKQRGHMLRRYTVGGVRFEESRGWYRVPEAFAARLGAIRQIADSPYSPPAFDVMTEVDALALDASEEQSARRKASPELAVTWPRGMETSRELVLAVDPVVVIQPALEPAPASAPEPDDHRAPRQQAERGDPPKPTPPTPEVSVAPTDGPPVPPELPPSAPACRPMETEAPTCPRPEPAFGPAGDDPEEQGEQEDEQEDSREAEPEADEEADPEDSQEVEAPTAPCEGSADEAPADSRERASPEPDPVEACASATPPTPVATTPTACEPPAPPTPAARKPAARKPAAKTARSKKKKR